MRSRAAVSDIDLGALSKAPPFDFGEGRMNQREWQTALTGYFQDMVVADHERDFSAFLASFLLAAESKAHERRISGDLSYFEAMLSFAQNCHDAATLLYEDAA